MARSFWIDKNGTPLIKEDYLKKPEEGEVRFETLYSLLSIGTERRIARGEVSEQLHSAMRVPYMQGSFELPIKYGYSLVGQYHLNSEKPSEKISGHVMHPHQDVCIVRKDDVFDIPKDVSPIRATLASNMETAVNAIWDSKVSLGDRVLIVGFGLIGSLIARILSFYPGLKIKIADINLAKIKLATEMGFSAVHNDDLERDYYDLSFHCSSSGNGLQVAINGVGFEGRVVELSWFGQDGVALELGGSFHSMRKQIISSQVSTLSEKQRKTWDLKRRKDLVFELLSKQSFDDHISEVIAFDDLPDFFAKTVLNQPSGLGYVVDYTRG